MIESVRVPDKFNDKMAETRENIADMGHLAKEAVQDKLHDLADSASAKYGAGKEKLQALEESFVGKVHDSPIKSLLIAAGAGLLLGFLLRRS